MARVSPIAQQCDGMQKGSEFCRNENGRQFEHRGSIDGTKQVPCHGQIKDAEECGTSSASMREANVALFASAKEWLMSERLQHRSSRGLPQHLNL